MIWFAMPICMMPCMFSLFLKLNLPNMKPAMPKITGKIKNEKHILIL